MVKSVVFILAFVYIAGSVSYVVPRKDPCELCNPYKPCLRGNKYGGYSCSSVSIFGSCDFKSKLCIFKKPTPKPTTKPTLRPILITPKPTKRPVMKKVCVYIAVYIWCLLILRKI